jgi:hypothetical protein
MYTAKIIWGNGGGSDNIDTYESDILDAMKFVRRWLKARPVGVYEFGVEHVIIEKDAPMCFEDICKLHNYPTPPPLRPPPRATKEQLQEYFDANTKWMEEMLG